MPQPRIHVTANASGPVRTETLWGREYRVVPAVLVRSQVLHNNIGRCYLPADDITAEWAEAVNWAPAVIDHPTKHGRHISARDVEVLEATGTGVVMNAAAEDGELRAEVFLDVSRAEKVEALTDILAALDAGDTVELSTGFPVAVETQKGVFNGRSYDKVVHPLGFDHLALSSGWEGACSVEDGCGLGVNCTCGEGADESDDQPQAPDAESFARSIWNHLKALVGNQDELSLDDIRRLVMDAAEERWGAEGVFVWVAELFEDDAVVEVDPQDGPATLLRVGYTVDETERTATLAEDFTEVERVTEFVPVANGRIEARHEYLDTDPTAGNPTPEEGEMNREELIAALDEHDDVHFRRESLEAMTDDELAHVANDAELGVEPEGEPGGDEPEADDDSAAANTDSGETPPPWASDLAETVNSIGERVDALESDIEPTRSAQEAERERLVSDIAANSDFEAEELEGKSLAELGKLHAAAVKKPASYVGLGAPRPKQPSKTPELGFTVFSTLGAGPGESIDARNGKES